MKKICLSFIALVILSYLYLLSLEGTPAVSHPATSLNWLNTAHRGGPGLEPEHTMRAYRRALNEGADALELDVHLSADGHLVLIHDSTLDRTTNASGTVSSMTLQQLQAIDAGSGESIPSLDSVFTEFAAIPMLIELKDSSPHSARRLCDMIRQYHRTANTIVGAFNLAPLEVFRTACPEVATGMAQSEVAIFMALQLVGLEKLHQSPAVSMQLPPEYYGVTILRKSLIKAAQSRGLVIQAWTINSTEAITSMFALGVDGIITDYPDRVTQIRNDRS